MKRTTRPFKGTGGITIPVETPDVPSPVPVAPAASRLVQVWLMNGPSIETLEIKTELPWQAFCAEVLKNGLYTNGLYTPDEEVWFPPSAIQKIMPK